MASIASNKMNDGMAHLPTKASEIDLSESVAVLFNPDDPKFASIKQRLDPWERIKQIYLLKKPTTINHPDLNEHLEAKINEEIVDEFKKLPAVRGAVVAESFDGTKSLMLLNFDDYFRLVSTEIWDSEDYGSHADADTMSLKLKEAAPYNLFYNTLKHSPRTEEQKYSINFTDLLCPSLGKLKNSLHITYMVKIWWLLGNYAARKLHKLPMTILHGYDHFPQRSIISDLYPNIKYHYIQLKTQGLGHHHSKLSIFLYSDDSLRVVVGTANLFGADWELYGNQVWISPRCPKLPPGSSQTDGESATGFKKALLDYLTAYTSVDQRIPGIQTWIQQVCNTDFQAVKVVLLFNVPGIQTPYSKNCMLYQVGRVLGKQCTIPAPKSEHNDWKIVIQSSSLGLVGIDGPDKWLCSTLLKALSSNKLQEYQPTIETISEVMFNVIYATMENVLNGHLGHVSGVCGKYEKGLKEEQKWLTQYMCQWKADSTDRTKIMPHSKCYLRISPSEDKMAYYFLTSSNLSRSGWGRPLEGLTVHIRSYELGVLFLPKFFKEEYFEIGSNTANKRVFPLMFDLPLTPYGVNDDPYCWDDVAIKMGLPLPPPDRNHYTRGRGGRRRPFEGGRSHGGMGLWRSQHGE